MGNRNSFEIAEIRREQRPDARGVVICELKTPDLTLQELAITSY